MCWAPRLAERYEEIAASARRSRQRPKVKAHQRAGRGQAGCADVVLMRSDPLDVPTALQVGRGTLRKVRQNLGWAIGYNAIALPIAAGIFEPAFGLVLRPEIVALSMSGFSLIVAVNALTLRRLRLPDATPPQGPTPPQAARPRQATAET
jgi:Cu2+-exporting ATPase